MAHGFIRVIPAKMFAKSLFPSHSSLCLFIYNSFLIQKLKSWKYIIIYHNFFIEQAAQAAFEAQIKSLYSNPFASQLLAASSKVSAKNCHKVSA
jgi:hypothetical protein